ncbi:unnamed protein product [Parascedosporium putredinis]|uniref:Peroxisomal adenine nucleotide transporter 1 n=1 Tax=Parascedosporium putredinis TaxID=1442378 RepID=A0A9P1HBG5_9PEZI|nr:unnamed protein product [Parascedosporium putredinis]CAI8003759.1 unnamed protein product [Parascedosporium putredinis]
MGYLFALNGRSVEAGSNFPWGRAAAGATGAVLANALVYPLDIVKTRLQVQVNPGNKAKKAEAEDAEAAADEDPHYSSTWDALTRIVGDEGVAGLYAGITGSLIGVASTNFAYFYWYSIVRTLYLKSGRASVPPSTLAELGLGAIAGAVAQIFTIPVAVVTTRQQTQRKDERKGMLETAKEVIDGPDGVSGLWRGLKASLVLVVNPAITYGAYERLKEVLFPGRKALKPWEAFSPHRRQGRPPVQAPKARNGKPFKSFGEVMKFIVDNEGVAGLFKGIGPQISKGLLVQGILMMTKERMELIFILFFRYLKTLRANRLAAAQGVVLRKSRELRLRAGRNALQSHSVESVGSSWELLHPASSSC